MHKLAVLGAGAWGTALAVQLAKNGHDVVLWAHSYTHAEHMLLQRENPRYLPSIRFPDSLEVTADLATALTGVDGVLVVVPSDAFSDTLSRVVQLTGRPQHLAWATKGFDPHNHRLLHQVVVDELGVDAPMAVLSGPTFADEVARGLPTAMVSASPQPVEAEFWAQAFHYAHFRMYTQADIAGVEVGGAFKNIMAIATGISDGMALGANARAALIARGMVEMQRFGALFDAQPSTLMGLAGLGDLVLTCTDDLSRNRRFGLSLAKSGKTAQQVQQDIGQVVEGVKAVRIVKAIAEKHHLELPIVEQVYQLVEGKISAEQAVKALLARELTAEQGASH